MTPANDSNSYDPLTDSTPLLREYGPPNSEPARKHRQHVSAPNARTPQTTDEYFVGHLEQKLRAFFTVPERDPPITTIRGSQIETVYNELRDEDKQFTNPLQDYTHLIQDDIDDAFIRAHLTEAIQAKIEELTQSRKQWINDMPKPLSTRLDKTRDLIQGYTTKAYGTHDTDTLRQNPPYNSDTISFKPGIVYDPESSPRFCDAVADPAIDVVQTDNVDIIEHTGCDHTAPLDAFGLELEISPQSLIICHSPSGSVYPFVPYQGVLICTCGDSLRNHRSPLCKHEIAACLLDRYDVFYPQIRELQPSILRRLAHPDYVQSQQEQVK